MTINEETLTAYALNELDPGERAAVESQLAHDPTARLFVEETRRTAAVLSQAFEAEDSLSLRERVAASSPPGEGDRKSPSSPGKSNIFHASHSPAVLPKGEGADPAFFPRYAVAAAFLLGVGVAIAVFYSLHQGKPQPSSSSPSSAAKIPADARQIAVNALIDRALQLRQQHLFETALVCVDNALIIDPNYRTAQLLSENLRGQIKDREARLAYERTKSNLSPELKARVEKLLAKATELRWGSDPSQAYEYLDQVLAIDPGNTSAKLMKEITEDGKTAQLADAALRQICSPDSELAQSQYLLRFVDPPMNISGLVAGENGRININSASPAILARLPWLKSGSDDREMEFEVARARNGHVGVTYSENELYRLGLLADPNRIGGTDDGEMGFDVSRARVQFDGHLYSENLFYRMRLEVGRNYDTDLGTVGQISYRRVGKGTINSNESLPAAGQGQLMPGQGAGDDGSTASAYSRIVENPFHLAGDDPLSTFSINVDTASYAIVRRYLAQQNSLPPPDAVRLEEMINYFSYRYAAPGAKDADPFKANIEVSACPWNPKHRLVRIGIKGREIPVQDRKPLNLVFLIDVSGSMNQTNKLPLVKESMKLLVNELEARDRVAMVVYAGNSGLVLPPTSGSDKKTITDALDRLEAGGSTNGEGGIQQAYFIAMQNFDKNKINRVILCTDGDWNVGVTDEGSLTRLIEEKAKTGVFLSVLGFGMDNLKDSMMVKLADMGNGNYGYVDTLDEAKKLLVEQMQGTMIAIAKDVKIQVEFNPAVVAAHRLVGYEKRVLAHQDFNDDKKDAGEIGAGHTITALYEVVPTGADAKTLAEMPRVDPLKYTIPTKLSDAAKSGEMLTLKIRYKQPDSTPGSEDDKSKLLEFPVKDGGAALDKASPDFKWAAAVATWGMILRDSAYRGGATFETVLDLMRDGIVVDGPRAETENNYRAEFYSLVKQSRALATPPAATQPAATRPAE